MNLRESGKKRAAIVTGALGAASIVAAGATSAALWLNTPVSGSTSVETSTSDTGTTDSTTTDSTTTDSGSSSSSSDTGTSGSGAVSSGSGGNSHATTSGS